MKVKVITSLVGILITFAILKLGYDSVPVALWVLLSAVLHEAAHMVAMRFTGIGVRSVGANGLAMFVNAEKESHARASSMARFVVAMAGPTVQVVFVMVFLRLHAVTGVREHLLIAYANASLLAYNMLANPFLDGGKAYRELLSSNMRSFGLYYTLLFINIATAICGSENPGFIQFLFGPINALMFLYMRSDIFKDRHGLSGTMGSWQTAIATVWIILYANGGIMTMKILGYTLIAG